MGIVELEELEKLSEDALTEQLSESIRKSNMGATKSAREVSKDMRDKYAVLNGKVYLQQKCQKR